MANTPARPPGTHVSRWWVGSVSICPSSALRDSPDVTKWTKRMAGSLLRKVASPTRAADAPQPAVDPWREFFCSVLRGWSSQRFQHKGGCATLKHDDWCQRLSESFRIEDIGLKRRRSVLVPVPKQCDSSWQDPGCSAFSPFHSFVCEWLRVASSGWLWQDSFWRSWATFRQLQIGNCQTGTDASTLKPLGQNDTHAISCYDILMNFATCFTPVQWNHFVNKEAIVKCIEQQHFNILSFFFAPTHRIGWWEHLQESPIFDGKNHGFL